MFFIFSDLGIRGNFARCIKKLQENPQPTSQEMVRGPGRRQDPAVPTSGSLALEVLASLCASSEVGLAGNPAGSTKGPGPGLREGGREGPCIEGGLRGWGSRNAERGRGLRGPSAQEAAQGAELFEGKSGQARSGREIGKQ